MIDGTQTGTQSFAICLAYCNLEAPDFCSCRTNFQFQYNQLVICARNQRDKPSASMISSRYMIASSFFHRRFRLVCSQLPCPLRPLRSPTSS